MVPDSKKVVMYTLTLYIPQCPHHSYLRNYPQEIQELTLLKLVDLRAHAVQVLTKAYDVAF